jgi:hypothetical protein
MVYYPTLGGLPPSFSGQLQHFFLSCTHERDRNGAHSVFVIHLHLAWITKYSKPVLVGDAAFQVRELMREICRSDATGFSRWSIHFHWKECEFRFKHKREDICKMLLEMLRKKPFC